MNEQLKYTILLIITLFFFLFEVGYIVFQVRNFIIQQSCEAKVMAMGFFKISSLFQIVVGILVIKTFQIQDSFLYFDLGETTLHSISFKAWHALYTLGIITGVCMIIASFMSFYCRFGISKEYIITCNGKKVPATKCTFAKNKNLCTITSKDGTKALPSILVKFNAETPSGKTALSILDENYNKI